MMEALATSGGEAPDSIVDYVRLARVSTIRYTLRHDTDQRNKMRSGVKDDGLARTLSLTRHS